MVLPLRQRGNIICDDDYDCDDDYGGIAPLYTYCALLAPSLRHRQSKNARPHLFRRAVPFPFPFPFPLPCQWPIHLTTMSDAPSGQRPERGVRAREAETLPISESGQEICTQWPPSLISSPIIHRFAVRSLAVAIHRTSMAAAVCLSLTNCGRTGRPAPTRRSPFSSPSPLLSSVLCPPSSPGNPEPWPSSRGAVAINPRS